MKTRVLMLGPGYELASGISALAETLVPALERRVDLLYMPTILRRPLKESGKISLQNVVFALSQYSHFLSVLHRFRPHIIHVHTSQGIGWLKDSFFVLIGKACHCRVILHVHAADFDRLYGGQSRFVQSYTRRVMGLADAVIAVSAEWRRYLAHIVPIDRVLTFTNCVAVDIMFPHVPERSTDGAKALFLGSVGPRKGAFDLLEAVGHLKSMGCSLHLWLAGYEEREGDLLKAHARLEELQLAEMCQLVGTVHGARKTELLNEANLFVLPSYNEGLPIAVLEAMAAGLAVVATPVGGVPEVIKDGYNGFLVLPGDTRALAEKLAMLANDQHLREEMGRRSREMAEQELDVKLYANRLVALYESLVRAE